MQDFGNRAFAFAGPLTPIDNQNGPKLEYF